jgi:Fic family protein
VAEVLKARWSPTFTEGLPRRERRGCEYEAYLPDPVFGRRFLLEGDVSADVTDAESAVRVLNAEATALTGLEGLARLLLRAEAVASSKIEGLEIGGRRLLHAEIARQLGFRQRDITAEEVLANIDAMTWAVDNVADEESIEIHHLLEVHRRLMRGTRMESEGGVIRNRQNWIGGNDYNPCGADYVPPPPEQVEPLLKDLCKFCNEDELPAVAQASIAHAQFETIHPFSDGNGRTGRALIHIVLRRRGLIPRVLPPISLVLATLGREYIRRLVETRYAGDPSDARARDGWNRWIAFFAAATNRAVGDARLFERRVAELQTEWRLRLGRLRQGSAADLLITALPGAPIVTVNSAATLLGRSYVAANESIAQLVKANVLRQIDVGRRNRAFEATELVNAFNELERQLASPGGDTRISPPARSAPARRPRKNQA